MTMVRMRQPTIEARVADLVARRQDQIRGRGQRELSGFDSASLSQYLYDDMEAVTA